MNEDLEFVHQMFAAQARATPERVAVSGGGRTITYLELHQQSNRMARYLRAQGIARSETVALMAERSIEMVVAVLGILKAGASLLLLDPHYPQQRLAGIIGEVSPRWMITQSTLRPSWEQMLSVWQQQERHLLLLGGTTASEHAADVTFHPMEDITACPSDDLEPINEGSDLIYLIYTSGSTGIPKGVMAAHCSVAHFIRWEIETFQVGASDRVSQFSALTFEPSMRDLFVPLCSGGTLCLPEHETIYHQERLLAWLMQEEISLVHCVPSLFRQLLSAVKEQPPEERAKMLPHLRVILMVGEALDVRSVKEWREIFGKRVTLVNFYSPTEATMVKMFHVIENLPEGSSTIPIGTGIPETHVLVLDEQGDECGADEAGEICIASPYLAIGYYKRPDLTEQKFLYRLLPDGQPVRLLCTGDLGKRLPDGNLVFVGRQDQQIKIRGHRIEPGDVETVLCRYPAVEQSVVLARVTDTGDSQLLAFILPAAGMPPQMLTSDGLMGFLQKQLPSYMVPSEVHLLRGWPLNTNGKIDRAELLRLAGTGEHLLRNPYLAPRTPRERDVAEMFSAELGIAQIGVKDNFFHIGGHSLQAALVLDRLKVQTRARLMIRDFFDHPTVEALARHIDLLVLSGQVEQF